MTLSDDRLAARPSSRARMVVVVGGSAGAVRPLLQVAEGLREGVGAAALVVLHRTENGHHMLPAILSRHSVYQAAQPSDGDPIQPDYIYAGPPGQHLEVLGAALSLNRRPKVNGQRPSIDLLFKSAAAAYGPAVLAVILSGTRDDGASGLLAVCRAGGVAMVQEPGEAEFPEMPRAAIARAGPVLVRTAEDIAASLGPFLEEMHEARLKTEED